MSPPPCRCHELERQIDTLNQALDAHAERLTELEDDLERRQATFGPATAYTEQAIRNLEARRP